ncbi:reverse transcriptase domain-containing protein [Tanacetum coccineum]
MEGRSLMVSVRLLFKILSIVGEYNYALFQTPGGAYVVAIVEVNVEELQAHIRHFESITNNQRYPDVPNTTIKLLLFPFSLDGVAKTWLDKEPPNFILSWDDLVSKFINFFFPPSKTTNLRNEITNFRQIAQESLSGKLGAFQGTLGSVLTSGFRSCTN